MPGPGGTPTPFPVNRDPDYPPTKFLEKTGIIDFCIGMSHPEMPDGVNKLTEFIKCSEIILVMCHGCEQKRPINAEYGAYVTNGISSCRHCRSNE